MTSSTATSLRPLPVVDEVDTSIPLLVQRIIQERGHFKSVTEQNLLDEIASQDRDADSDGSSDEALDKPQTLEARRSELALARVDIANHLGRAQNDIGMALDFVSLLLTRDRLDKATLTLSPFMKDLLKDSMRSLAFDSFEPSPPTAADVQANNKVALGWNLKGLGESADALLASATTLEREMKKEAQYWDDVLSISEKGWSLCRIGKGSTIGVRYGFAEAAPQFNALGLAALRPDGDGSVKLDQGLRRAPKSLRVQVKQGQRIISRSRVRPCESEQAPIEVVIRQARDSLFEEELYHELSREARSMLPCGITVEDGTIVAPLDMFKSPQNTDNEDSSRRVLIDLVARSSDTLETVDQDPSAETIAISLRILMTSVHGQKFRKRIHPPPPLSKDKLQPPTFYLLRPVLGHVFHHVACTTVQAILVSISAGLRCAGLGPVLEITHNTPVLAPPFKSATSRKTKSERVERFVESLCKPLSTTISLAFKEHKAYVDVATHLEPPYYGTKFRVTQVSSYATSQPAPATFDQAAELRAYIASLVGHLIAVTTVQGLPGWQVNEGSATLFKANTQPAKRRKTVHVAIDQGTLALIGTTADNGRAKVWGVWDGQVRSGQEEWDSVLHQATKV